MTPTHATATKDEWEAAWRHLLVREKELTRARDALAAERRRMPWLPVERDYEFVGPDGKASLLDLFDGRRQLIVYRAFFEPGVHGWPEHACVGCSNSHIFDFHEGWMYVLGVGVAGGMVLQERARGVAGERPGTIWA